MSKLDGESMVRHTPAMRDFRMKFLALAIAWLAAPSCPAAPQRPIAELEPSATFALGNGRLGRDYGRRRLGGKQRPVRRASHRSENHTLIARVELPGEACAGLVVGAGSIWLVIDKLGSLVRINPADGSVLDTFYLPEGS
jgi:hypothetical protein